MNTSEEAGAGAGAAANGVSSIWTERRPASRLFEAPRRSRAGTLPSRWGGQSLAQGLGSLALCDPPEVAVQVSPPSIEFPLTEEPSYPRAPPSPSLLGVSSPRSRSGSMNSAYSPFGQSIWSVERTRSNTIAGLGGAQLGGSLGGAQGPLGGAQGLSPLPQNLAPQHPGHPQNLAQGHPQGHLSPYSQVQALGAPQGVPQSVPPMPQVPQAQGVSFPGVQSAPVAFPAQSHAPAPHSPLMRPASPAPLSIDDLSPVPTAALWVSNVPAGATAAHLAVFSGEVQVLPHRQCALVTFGSVQAAVDAQRATNGRELFAGRGPALVGFAREPVGPAPVEGTAGAVLAALSLLEAPDVATTQLVHRAFRAHDKCEIPHAPEAGDRVYVSTVLREIRKRIDTQQLTRGEIEEYALDMMGELPLLLSDYMGNTVVQQLFEHCGEDVKDMMLRVLVPHLAQAGVHKNGTWAVQKIIDVATTHRQRGMLERALRPYTTALLLDQYGNYVVQCCLKHSEWVYEELVANLGEIASGRFGARAVRTVLESSHIPRPAYNALAGAILEAASPLSLNPNGALLVGWLLDSQIPARYAAVAQRLLPSLVPLATSKTGSLTLLKIVSSRSDLRGTRLVLDTLFAPSSEYAPLCLQHILSDPNGHGPMFLYKLLTTGFSETSLDKHVAVNKIRVVLLQPGAHVPQHKRLLEEVGLGMLSTEEWQ